MKTRTTFHVLIARIEAEAEHRRAINKHQDAIAHAAVATTKLNNANEATARAEKEVEAAALALSEADLTLKACMSKAADEFFLKD